MLVALFLLALFVGIALAPPRREPSSVRREPTWQERLDDYLSRHGRETAARIAERILDELGSDDAGFSLAAASPELIAMHLEDWTQTYEETYRNVAPRDILLQQILQQEYGHLDEDPFSTVADRLSRRTEGAELWPLLIEVAGAKRVFFVDLRDWAQLFDASGGPIGPKRRLEARIRNDLLAMLSKPSERGERKPGEDWKPHHP